ncbi:class I SAM-dependent methyltransferase [Specibacter cremeus]|uniref:class I SAM-dependent methyltransferase n=1 Tax=Specibacter cremeus TaxID=1629051 RepID=UPI0013DE28D5|nr:class I SAM-dependent methyltransferase [Specibacter cremeus]
MDIFSYFVCDGWFHGTFHARERAADVPILPLGTVAAGDRALPAPADPDAMLAAIYGPTWRTPDPAFRFETPESAGRRYFWWLNHFDAFREDWEDFHRSRIGASVTGEPSVLATWLAVELPAGSTVLEFGCGLGADARHLAAHGHRVLATDFSRPAIARARELAEEHDAARGGGGPVRFAVANQNSVRDMAAVVRGAAELAGPDAPITVVARNVVDGLYYLGRDVTLYALKHLLGRGGRAYLQMRNPKSGFRRDPFEPVGETIFDTWDLTGRLAFYGLTVERANFLDEPGPAGAALSYIIRKATP